MPTAPAIITKDITCLVCGYNLRGLSGEQTCPECGEPVGNAISGRNLASYPAPWRTMVWFGAWLVVVGLALLPLCHCLSAPFPFLWIAGESGTRLAVTTVLSIQHAMLVLGVFLISLWDTHFVQDRTLRRARLAARVGAVVLVLALAVVAVAPVVIATHVHKGQRVHFFNSFWVEAAYGTAAVSLGTVTTWTLAALFILLRRYLAYMPPPLDRWFHLRMGPWMRGLVWVLLAAWALDAAYWACDILQYAGGRWAGAAMTMAKSARQLGRVSDFYRLFTDALVLVCAAWFAWRLQTLQRGQHAGPVHQ
jgi:hypothetical protein